jgi:nucleoside phosphorylase
MAVFEFPHVFGPRAIDEMIQSIENPKASAETRIMAVGGLVQIGGEKTIQYLKEMITDKANNYPKEVLRAASDALGELSPAVLAGIKGKQAEETKARLAFRRDILFLNGKVLDVNPSSMKSSSKVTASSPIDWPISADIGVFLALQEEFDSFRDLLRRRGGVTWVPLDDPQKAFTYYRGEIKTPYTQQTVSVIAVCASEMGPERAANLASTYLTRCVTKTLVVVGIAGSLDSELRLGDVLVPNEVDAYLENSAAEDIGGSWVLTLSGRHFTADAHLLNQVRQLGGKAPVLLRGWESRAKRRLQRLLGAEDARRSLEKNLAKAKPEVFAADHHLATGPTVGKSFAFAEWLRSTNRKVSAMEMETAAVFDALETEIYRRRRLAIRGISDFADRRKTKVEKGFRGKFRQLSLLNASDYFLTLVEAGVFAEPISEND